MSEEKIHECPEQKGRKISWDMFCSATIEISSNAEGTWFCEGGDASLRIVYCPFCGAKLP
jgi:hypothetical protein